jgi:putative endonuclease
MESKKPVNRYHVYILADKKGGLLYVGMANSIASRVSRHRSNAVDSFTAKHGINKLVRYERAGDLEDARRREAELKAMSRDGLVALVESDNPDWSDLISDFFDPPTGFYGTVEVKQRYRWDECQGQCQGRTLAKGTYPDGKRRGNV